MAIQIEHEKTSQKLLYEVQDLFGKNGLNKQITPWQFSNNSLGVIVARDHLGVLVGYNGTIAIELYRNNGEDIKALWSGDFFIDYRYRNLGIGKNIKKALHEKFDTYILALGISKSALPVLESSGWITMTGYRVYNKPVLRANLKSLLFYGLSILTRKGKRDLLNVNNYNVIYSSLLPSKNQINALWANIKPEHNNCVVRNYEYFLWRYQSFPQSPYKYLYILKNATISGLVIYRFVNSTIKIVDYLSPINNFEMLHSFIIHLTNLHPKSPINFNISCPSVEKNLLDLGFIKAMYNSKFAFKATGPLNEEKSNWLLTAGDSDGDIISAQNNKLETILHNTISDINSEELVHAYNAIKTNNNTSIFTSYEWLKAWWDTWSLLIGKEESIHLEVVIFYENSEPISIFPLYKIDRKSILGNYVEYQFLGNAWKIFPTIRSEYIEPRINIGKVNQTYLAFSIWLNNKPKNCRLVWQDCTFPLSPLFNYLSIEKSETGVRLDTTSLDFRCYIKKLGKNTRLKGVNRIKSFEIEYPDSRWFKYKKNTNEIKEFFKTINEFHSQRWGKPCFDIHATKFHSTLALNNKINYELLGLEVNNTVVSVLMNIKYNSVTYNIHSGFCINFNKKYSLGTMHLMKSIQDAFHNENVYQFDVLAGQGLKSDYKKHYKGETVNFDTNIVFTNRYSLIKYLLFRYLRKISLKVLSLKSNLHIGN